LIVIPTRHCARRAAVLACVLLSACVSATPLRAANVAKFRVTDEVLHPAVGPFTATVEASLGESFLRGGGEGFEPAQWRQRLTATADAPDRVVCEMRELTHFDSYREGMLDGAEVMVFRVDGGKMKLVRRDRVKAGGHAASGWNFFHGGKMVAGTNFHGGFESWSRPDVPYWFDVVAVDASGRMGPPSEAVRVMRGPGEAGKVPEEGLIPYKEPGAPRGETPDLVAKDLAAPGNLRARLDPATGQAVLEWEPVAGAAGYRIRRSDQDPAEHRGYFLDLEKPAAYSSGQIKKGDMVIVGKPLLNPSRKTSLSHRVFDSKAKAELVPRVMESLGFPDEDPVVKWEFAPHDAATPVTNAGQYALRLDFRDNREHGFDFYAYGPAGEHWWPVFEPGVEYVMEIWARREGPGEGVLRAGLRGFHETDAGKGEFAVGPEWKKYEHVFTLPRRYEGKGPIGKAYFLFQGPGTYFVDNLTIRRKDTPPLEAGERTISELRDASLSHLRTHQFIKSGRASHSMEQLTNPAGAIFGTGGNTLPQTLAIMEKAGVNPWLQIEYFMSPDEWRGLVEYLAAPYDPATDTPETKPWSAKRFAQGRAKPWSDAFDHFYFEISNETWNRLFEPWTFQSMPDAATGREADRGTVYGLFQEWVIDQLRSRPYWESAGLDKKFDFVLGGWATQTKADGYGQRAAAASPRSKFMTIAAYNGGWDEGEGPTDQSDAALQRVLMHAPQVGEPRSKELAAARKAARDTYELGVYEAGPGYALSGLNNQPKMTDEEVEAQARSMKSLASGTATLDSFLEKAVHGFRINNFFTFSRGRTHWNSHAQLKDGGQAHVPWMAVALFNREGTGDLLKVETIEVPTLDMPGYKRRPAGHALPSVACYATRSGDRLNVFLLSRRLDNHPVAGEDGFTPTTVELPITGASKVTLHKITGNPRDHNLDGEIVKVRTVALDPASAGPSFTVNAKTGSTDAGLPPASTFLYVFEGAEFAPAAHQPAQTP